MFILEPTAGSRTSEPLNLVFHVLYPGLEHVQLVPRYPSHGIQISSQQRIQEILPVCFGCGTLGNTKPFPGFSNPGTWQFPYSLTILRELQLQFNGAEAQTWPATKDLEVFISQSSKF